jgi:hypothetical protein
MGITRFGDYQHELDIADFSDCTAESTGNMTALGNPPHVLTLGSETAAWLVGGQKHFGKFFAGDEFAGTHAVTE